MSTDSSNQCRAASGHAPAAETGVGSRMDVRVRKVHQDAEMLGDLRQAAAQRSSSLAPTVVVAQKTVAVPEQHVGFRARPFLAED